MHSTDPDATLHAPPGAAPVPAAGAANATAAPLADMSGRVLGAWRLLRKIGQGGMGEVWLAERCDGLYQAQAAIKLLRSDLPADQLADRFARERAVLARLDHASIARLLDAGVDQGLAFIVLEYVQGLPLAEHVRHACPDLASRVRLLIRIAEAVEHAHGRLVVHRDLKPANVLVLADGTPKLLDFGIAGLLGDDEVVDGQLTRLSGRRLTLGYAAPEQLTGEPVGVTADVFSLGVMLFELCAGETPLGKDHSSRTAIEHALLHQEAPRLTRTGGRTRSPLQPVDFERVRGDLEAIVAKTLRKNPADRYGSMRLLIDDLQRWLGHHPVSVRRDDWRHRIRLWLRRHALATTAGITLLLALGGGLAASLWQWQRAEAALRSSDRVTRYLGDLLGSADPGEHQGRVPTVLQLLEHSRRDLAQRFADDPVTQQRLLEVLVQSYQAMNRSDLALPLAEQRLALLRSGQGPDAVPTLQAQLDIAKAHSLLQAFDKVLQVVEPIEPELRRVRGDLSDDHLDALNLLTYAYTRLGRYDEARRWLAEARRVTEAMYPPGSTERVALFNRLQVLETSAGRLREGLAAIQQTQPYWDQMPADRLRERHTMERNLLAVQIRLGDVDGVVERGLDLLQRIDALMGAGSDQATGLRAELARALLETGRYDEAWQQRQAIVDGHTSVAARDPQTTLPDRCQAQLARTLTQAPSAGSTAGAAERRAGLRALAAEAVTLAPALGVRGDTVWACVLRSALLLGELPLAEQALQTLREDRHRGGRVLTRSRIDQLDGELQRARGRLDRSRELLQRRSQDQLALAETRIPAVWSALLDEAVTALDQRDPAAASLLAQARQLRPPGLPPGVPLDLLQAWLQARLQAQQNSALSPTAAHVPQADPATARAWAALARRVGRDADAPRDAVLLAALL